MPRFTTAVKPAIKEGYTTDFISGELVKETPEEVDAVQVFSRQLVEDYGYTKEQVQTRAQVRTKAKSPEAFNIPFPDIAVFSNKKKNELKKSLKTEKEVIKNTVGEHSIVMTRAGNSGIAANIPPHLVGGVASGFLINITIKKEVNPYYIVSFLNSQYGQMQLERISSGSILQSIRSSDLKKVQIILPNKEIQDRIGNKIKEAVYAKAAGRKSIEEADRDILHLVRTK